MRNLVYLYIEKPASERAMDAPTSEILDSFPNILEDLIKVHSISTLHMDASTQCLYERGYSPQTWRKHRLNYSYVSYQQMDISSLIIKDNFEIFKLTFRQSLLSLWNCIILYIIKSQMNHSSLKIYEKFEGIRIP